SIAGGRIGGWAVRDVIPSKAAQRQVAKRPPLRYADMAVDRWRPLGACSMAVHRRIEVTNLSGSAGEVSMVRFLDRKIIDAANIQELGDELFGLVEKEQRKNLLL